MNKDLAHSILVVESNVNALHRLGVPIDHLSISTGTVYQLGYSGSYGIPEYLVPREYDDVPIGGVPQFERCPYCNRKNHVYNAVCDGCGGVL